MSNGHQQTGGSNHSRFHQDRWSRDGDAVSLVRPRAPERPFRFSAEPEPVVADLSASALVIIDMQNDFLHADGWFAAERSADVGALHKPIPVINTLAAAFRAVSAPVIHVNWGVRPDTANLPANVLDKACDCGGRAGYGERIPSGHVLASGDWGARSFDGIDTEPQDILVHKHRFSGFRDNELDHILRRLDMRHLFFAGVNIDRCVFATLMDAAFEGFDTVLIEDACATVSPKYVSDATLYLVRLLYGFSASSKNILAGLIEAAPAELG